MVPSICTWPLPEVEQTRSLAASEIVLAMRFADSSCSREEAKSKRPAAINSMAGSDQFHVLPARASRVALILVWLKVSESADKVTWLDNWTFSNWTPPPSDGDWTYKSLPLRLPLSFTFPGPVHWTSIFEPSVPSSFSPGMPRAARRWNLASGSVVACRLRSPSVPARPHQADGSAGGVSLAFRCDFKVRLPGCPPSSSVAAPSMRVGQASRRDISKASCRSVTCQL